MAPSSFLKEGGAELTILMGSSASTETGLKERFYMDGWALFRTLCRRIVCMLTSLTITGSVKSIFCLMSSMFTAPMPPGGLVLETEEDVCLRTSSSESTS